MVKGVKQMGQNGRDDFILKRARAWIDVIVIHEGRNGPCESAGNWKLGEVLRLRKASPEAPDHYVVAVVCERCGRTFLYEEKETLGNPAGDGESSQTTMSA